MVCPQCGAKAIKDAIFCHKCGHRVAEQFALGDQPTGTDSAASAAPAAKFKAAAAQLDSSDAEELELWQGGYSPRAMIGAWCTSGLVSILLLVIGILWVKSGWLWVLLLLVIIGFWAYNLLRLVHRRLSVSYVLTNQRFIHESGVLRRVTDRIEVIDIDDITFEQGVVERMMGVGSIKIASSDRTHPELMLYGIENVAQVSGLIDDTRRAERRRRGLHIENI
jgi:uncharacterized membrane protein YdbT with pleckstrin-like domain